MNKQRRKDITKLTGALSVLTDTLEDFMGQSDDLLAEEQEYFNNMPESFQAGEKGEASEAAVDKLQEAWDALDAAKEAIQEAITALEEATA